MATNSKVFSITLTDKLTFLWRGRDNTYKGISSKLGVKVLNGGDTLPENGQFGGNQKPPKIYIRTTEGSSYVRFIDPDKIEEQVYKRKLIGEKIKNPKGQDEKICFVSVKSN